MPKALNPRITVLRLSKKGCFTLETNLRTKKKKKNKIHDRRHRETAENAQPTSITDRTTTRKLSAANWGTEQKRAGERGEERKEATREGLNWAGRSFFEISQGQASKWGAERKGTGCWSAKELLPLRARMQITAAGYTGRGHCCCRGERRLMLLRDRARAEAAAANGNTSDSCWSARELLEAKERELQYFDDAQEGLGVWDLGL